MKTTIEENGEHRPNENKISYGGVWRDACWWLRRSVAGIVTYGAVSCIAWLGDGVWIGYKLGINNSPILGRVFVERRLAMRMIRAATDVSRRHKLATMLQQLTNQESAPDSVRVWVELMGSSPL